MTGFSKKVVALILLVLIVATPLAAVQTQDDYIQGKADGEQAASGNFLWFFAGAGCGLIGVGAAYLMKPGPPAHAMVGKSANYAIGYRDGYGNKSRNQNTLYACGGLAAFIAIFAAAGGFQTE